MRVRPLRVPVVCPNFACQQHINQLHPSLQGDNLMEYQHRRCRGEGSIYTRSAVPSSGSSTTSEESRCENPRGPGTLERVRDSCASAWPRSPPTRPKAPGSNNSSTTRFVLPRQGTAVPRRRTDAVASASEAFLRRSPSNPTPLPAPRALYRWAPRGAR